MQNKVAIILWLYHTDLAEEFVQLLRPLNDHIDIFLGLCKDNENTQAESIFKEHFPNNLSIDYLDNAGTDILPTLHLLDRCKKYPTFFKLHSKRNNWGFLKQVNWRAILLNDLLVPENFFHILQRFNHHSFGMAGPKSFIMRDNEYTNVKKIEELVNVLNIDYNKLRIKSFIGGNMFAAKTELFDKLLKHKSDLENKLSQEVGYIIDDDGGTYVHSMERIMGYLVEYHNKSILGCPKTCKLILTNKTKSHRLHLVDLYNNDCYVQENPNVYGTTRKIDELNRQITWKNHKEHTTQIYTTIQPNTLINVKLC